MKGIWRRFGFYLIGLSIGSIFVVTVFGVRSCSWTPNSRVIRTIQSKVIVFPENQIEALNELGINKSNIFNYLVKGSVDFSSSLKELGVFPKVYVFKANDTIHKRLQFSLYEDSYISVVHVLDDNENATQYDSLQGWGEIALLPRDSALIFIDNSNYTQCKARGLVSKDEKDIVKAMKKTGKILFSESKLMLPKAEQQMSFFQNDTLEVNAKTIWFEGRITFKDFTWDYKLDCE